MLEVFKPVGSLLILANTMHRPNSSHWGFGYSPMETISFSCRSKKDLPTLRPPWTMLVGSLIVCGIALLYLSADILVHPPDVSSQLFRSHYKLQRLVYTMFIGVAS
ncbi:hypothetical protein AAC387_Pa05g1704 [Persea americana]